MIAHPFITDVLDVGDAITASYDIQGGRKKR